MRSASATLAVLTSLRPRSALKPWAERYAPFWGFETSLEWNVADQFGDALTHEVGVPVTYVQALRAKGHRDRLKRFSNTPITRDKYGYPEGANLRHWLSGAWKCQQTSLVGCLALSCI